MVRANTGKKFTGTTLVTSGGGGGGGTALTVEEQDGNPTVTNVNTIRVSNGTLTNEGGGIVSIITGGGGSVPSAEYGEVVDPGGTSITLALTYVGFNTGAVGELSGMTFSAGAGNDPDTLAPNSDGVYQLVASFSISSQEANRNITAAVSVNGTIDTDTEVHRSFTASGSSGSFSITKLLDLTAGDEVGIEIKTNTTPNTIDVDNISFNLTSMTNSSGGGSPAGPSGAVQYNNAGSFGGSSQHFYDDSNLRVGIGTSTPARKLDVKETTTQLRLDYNGTEYTDIFSDGGGELQIIPSGGVVLQPTGLNSTNRHGSYVLDAFTTDATPTNMDLRPGAGNMVLTTNSTWFFDALVIGKQDASTNAITVKLEGCILREAGNASIQGAVFKFVVHDASAGTWDIDAIASGNNLEIQVTGAAGTTIDWTANVRTTEVQD